MKEIIEALQQSSDFEFGVHILVDCKFFMTFFNKKTNDCNLNTFSHTHFNIRKHDIS